MHACITVNEGIEYIYLDQGQTTLIANVTFPSVTSYSLTASVALRQGPVHPQCQNVFLIAPHFLFTPQPQGSTAGQWAAVEMAIL